MEVAWETQASWPVLASAGRCQSVLGGANLAAIGDGSADRWEVFQFARAELIAPQTYLLRDRLRGQAGSEHCRSLLPPK